MGLSRNLSVMAGLQSAPNPYYSDKSHVFNKQLFGQNAGANMGYGQQQQMQSQQAQSMYGRQMAQSELQTHDLKTGTTQDRKSRKKKSSSTKGEFFVRTTEDHNDSIFFRSGNVVNNDSTRGRALQPNCHPSTARLPIVRGHKVRNHTHTYRNHDRSSGFGYCVFKKSPLGSGQRLQLRFD